MLFKKITLACMTTFVLANVWQSYAGTNDKAKLAKIAAFKSKPALLNPHVKYIAKGLPISIPEHFALFTANSVSTLLQAINQAHANKGNSAIVIADGVYAMPSTIAIRQPNIFLLSASGDPTKTVLVGNGMKATAGVDNLISVNAAGFVLDGLTLKEVGNHLIQIRGELDADFPIIRNCILKDGYEQFVKVSYHLEKKSSIYSDSGVVEGCLFEYTAGIAPNYYTGGVDAHGVQNWHINDNVFKGFASPTKHIAEHAIHLWNNTVNNIIAGNVIINSDRGIGLGMYMPRTSEQLTALKFSNFAGVVRNNYIYHSDNQHPYADTGIIVENSPNTLIENNVIYFEHDYDAAIEYRFLLSQGVEVAGNQVNKAIISRNGGKAKRSANRFDLTKADFLVQLNQHLDGFKFTHLK